MKKLQYLLVILTLSSCFMFEESGIEMQIQNMSDKPITGVEFATTEKLKALRIDRIESNEIVTGFLSMKKNITDGEYLLTFTRANSKKEKIKGGYYTNGSPLNKRVVFVVENDTIMMRLD